MNNGPHCSMGPKSNALVSVVMPAYNEEGFIEAAIDSVQRQTYKSVELIVVDDGSTDGTATKIPAEEANLCLIKAPHRGACHARNLGESLAQGDYLMFLDADDVLAEDTIEGLVAVQKSVKSSRVISVCGWSELSRDEQGHWVETRDFSSFDPEVEDSLTAWIRGYFYPTCALLWPRSLYDELGGWDENLSNNQDGDLVMRALIKGASLARSRVGRGYYRRHDDEGCGADNRVRISARRDLEAFQSQWTVFNRVQALLDEEDRLEDYRIPLGQAFHSIAKNSYRIDPNLATRCETRGLELAGTDSIVGSFLHRQLYRTLGLAGKERLRSLLVNIIELASRLRFFS